MLALQRVFVFVTGRMDVRTDIMCENNDHLFGRGFGGSITANTSFASMINISEAFFQILETSPIKIRPFFYRYDESHFHTWCLSIPVPFCKILQNTVIFK